MAQGCRGSFNLLDAKIETTPGNNIIIQPGGTRRTGQVFHLRAKSDQERQSWIDTLQLAKQMAGNLRQAHRKQQRRSSSLAVFDAPAKDSAMPLSDRDDESSESADKHEIRQDNASTAVLKEITAAGGNNSESLLSTADDNDNDDDDGSDDFFSDEESMEVYKTGRPNRLDTQGLRQIITRHDARFEECLQHENMQGMAETWRAMQSKVLDFLDDADRRLQLWEHILHKNEQQRKDLEAAVESLAHDNRKLERGAEMAAKMGLVLDDTKLEEDDEIRSRQDDDDEFFDAASDLSPQSSPGPTPNELVGHSYQGKPEKIIHEEMYRTAIPFKPNKRVSLWKIMKDCIGKDLSKIPMPVNFNEPISFTQRLSEDLEYSELLDKAVRCTSSQQRLAYVAAFTISSFSSGADRTGKPFNPLLGETFELDRFQTKGWRVLLEQVSHHPPIAAFHAESQDWVFWQEFSMDSKFRGKYLEIIPTGVSHLVFKKTGDHYTWTKVHTTVHNIILGKLWMENNGLMEIVNHKHGDKCTLEYLRASFFSNNDLHSVRGNIKDSSGNVHFTLEGKWHTLITISTPDAPEDKVVIWQRTPPITNFDKMYGFTRMAIESNELSPYEAGCAMTDSRYRPDKNLMEIGDWDMANRVKHLLEEGQRHRRREYDRLKQRWVPMWFEPRADPIHANRKTFQYKGGYWEAKSQARFGQFPLVDVYDIRPVESKDTEAAVRAREAMTLNDHSQPLTSDNEDK